MGHLALPYLFKAISKLSRISREFQDFSKPLVQFCVREDSSRKSSKTLNFEATSTENARRNSTSRPLYSNTLEETPLLTPKHVRRNGRRSVKSSSKPLFSTIRQCSKNLDFEASVLENTRRHSTSTRLCRKCDRRNGRRTSEASSKPLGSKLLGSSRACSCM